MVDQNEEQDDRAESLKLVTVLGFPRRCAMTFFVLSLYGHSEQLEP